MFPKKDKNGNLIFKDYPDFKPNLTPREIFLRGSMGGTYWREIKSVVTGKTYKNVHLNYPNSWWKGIPDYYLISPWEEYNKDVNKYKVKVGTTLEFWEDKGWISKYHPYGWIHWYCDFFMGKRCPDDLRQINRWIRTAGPNSRFRTRLLNMIKNRGKIPESEISPKIKQTLQHWAVFVS